MSSLVMRDLRKAMPAAPPDQSDMEHCRPFIDAVGDQVLVIGRDYGVMMTNRTFLEQSGLSEGQAVGRRCYELTHRSEVPCGECGEQCPLDEVMRTGSAVRVTHEHFDADGTPCYVDIIGAALRDKNGRVLAMVESIRDVTEQRRLAAELRQRNSDLEEARRRRDEFTSTICHELKNILNVLSLNASALHMKLLDDPERKRAQLIIAEARRLARLVGDLNDAAAIETQRFSLAKAPCDLSAIVIRRAEAQQLATQRHRILVDTPEAPIEGDWDEERLSQVVDNLIANAVKYSPSGGAVHVMVVKNAHEALVSVTDQGVGIPEARLPFLFKPYARANREIRGLGLGLFVSRGIIEAHGGRIWATSQEHQGTTLVFALPLAREVIPA